MVFPAIYTPAPPYVHPEEFSWRSESRYFFSRKMLNICCWPLFQFYQRKFSRSAFMISCKKLPGFSELWEMIQKGSFAYNTLYLGLNPVYRSAADLADITTLALFFGDEFIDGIMATSGKLFMKKLMAENTHRFYLIVKTGSGKIKLQYAFDVNKLIPQAALGHVNEKYGISYLEFYKLLQHFLELINKRLAMLPASKGERAAFKIAEACNTCFESFLHDVNSDSCNEIRAIPEVIHFHELKTAYMQKKLLELRCILVEKETGAEKINGWMDMMRVIQVYDDIQDIINDDGEQDNIVLSAAYHLFHPEWEWLRANRHLLKEEHNASLLLSLYMPCSIAYCMQMAAEKISRLDWEQQKIMHYILLSHRYKLYTGSAGKTGDNKNTLLTYYQMIKGKMLHMPVEAIKSFIIDTCMHLHAERKQLLRNASLSVAYQLKYNLLSLPVATKAAIFDELSQYQ